jgi:predicted lipoprotein with Yx(FWY)xxD motif
MREIWGAAGLAAVAVVVAACGSSATSSSPTAPASSTAASTPASSSTLMTATINGTKVLTNSAGFSLYWFALDTPTTSKCNGSCATYWPPVKGPAIAGAGVTGKLGVITRSDGTKQATYDGHPLYTYVGDTAPLQAKGNALKASGGLWYEMTVSGATPAATSSAISGSGGSGYLSPFIVRAPYLLLPFQNKGVVINDEISHARAIPGFRKFLWHRTSIHCRISAVNQNDCSTPIRYHAGMSRRPRLSAVHAAAPSGPLSRSATGWRGTAEG